MKKNNKCNLPQLPVAGKSFWPPGPEHLSVPAPLLLFSCRNYVGEQLGEEPNSQSWQSSLTLREKGKLEVHPSQRLTPVGEAPQSG